MDNPSMSRLPREPRKKNPYEGAAIENKVGDHMHQAAESMHKAEPHGKHMILSHDGFGMKSHSVDEQGQHEEHEEGDADEHVKRFMGTSEGESGEEPEENDGNLY